MFQKYGQFSPGIRRIHVDGKKIGKGVCIDAALDLPATQRAQPADALGDAVRLALDLLLTRQRAFIRRVQLGLPFLGLAALAQRRRTISQSVRVNPQASLRWILAREADHKMTRLEDLMPWTWAKE